MDAGLRSPDDPLAERPAPPDAPDEAGPRRGRVAPLPLRMALAVGSLLTVAPLLAWVEGLGAFSAWFVACTAHDSLLPA